MASPRDRRHAALDAPAANPAAAGDALLAPRSHAFVNTVMSGHARAHLGDVYEHVAINGPVTFLTAARTRRSHQRRSAPPASQVPSAYLSNPLRELFASCETSFEVIGQDFAPEVLETKFQNLVGRFIAWGMACGLESHSAYDPRLDEARIKPFVENMLKCIAALLQDKKKLKDKYGLRLEGASPRQSLQNFRQFFSGSEERASSPSVRWTINDPRKFNKLVEQLKEFLNDLEKFTQSLEVPKLQRSLIDEEIQSISDISLLQRMEIARTGPDDMVSDAASQRLGVLREESFGDGHTLAPSTFSADETFVTAPTQLLSETLEDSSRDDGSGVVVGTGDQDMPLLPSVHHQTQNARIGAGLVPRPSTSSQEMKINTSCIGKNLMAIRTKDFATVEAIPDWGSGLYVKNSMDSGQKRRVLQLHRTLQNGPDYVSVVPIDDNMFDLLGSFEGPPGSPYEGGIFRVSIKLSADTITPPPKFRLITRIYHPNIDATGKICLDVLDKKWNPALTLAGLILSIMSLLESPNTEDPLVPEIAEVYIKDRDLYNTNARAYTARYAMQADKDESHSFQSLPSGSQAAASSYWKVKVWYDLAKHSVEDCLDGMTTEARTAATRHLDNETSGTSILDTLAGSLSSNLAAIKTIEKSVTDARADEARSTSNWNAFSPPLFSSRAVTLQVSLVLDCSSCSTESLGLCHRHRQIKDQGQDTGKHYSNFVDFVLQCVRELQASTDSFISLAGLEVDPA